MSQPRVSVIIPVHNSERYLAECLDSVLGQTESNIEVICVDDGSIDSSPAILDRYAQSDQRVRALHQEASNAGHARNIGLKLATGTYLSFLDSDDFFEPEMLKTSADEMDRTKADICVFGSWVYDEDRKANRQAKWNLKIDNVPDAVPFSWRDLKNSVFDTFGNCVWNKLYRTSFVVSNELRFQEIPRANDLLFSCSSLILASRITVVNQSYVHYRVSTQTSLQATNDQTPLSFLDALDALHAFLEDRGLSQPLEQSFADHLLDAVVYNADSLQSLEGLLALKSAAINRIEPTYHLLSLPEDSFSNQIQLEQYRDLCELAPIDYLFKRSKLVKMQRENLYWDLDWREWNAWCLSQELEAANNELDALRDELAKTKQELTQLRDSFSYRLGHALVTPVRVARDATSPHRR